MLRAANFGDTKAIERLLGVVGLPEEGVRQHLENFLVVHSDGELVGVAGFEVYGEVGLLRSVAVVPSKRGRGIGAKLVANVQRQACARGILELYLLTDSAAPFFERHGYHRVSRSVAPIEIRQSEEFRHLCPESALLMRCKLI